MSSLSSLSHRTLLFLIVPSTESIRQQRRIFYVLVITFGWWRKVYSAYPIAHNHIDTQNRDSSFQSFSPNLLILSSLLSPTQCPDFGLWSPPSWSLSPLPSPESSREFCPVQSSFYLLLSSITVLSELSSHQSPSLTPPAFFFYIRSGYFCLN